MYSYVKVIAMLHYACMLLLDIPGTLLYEMSDMKSLYILALDTDFFSTFS
jgi:hypothetical protein